VLWQGTDTEGTHCMLWWEAQCILTLPSVHGVRHCACCLQRGLAPRVFEYLFAEIDKAQDEQVRTEQQLMLAC
jgi:hypothetical protein